MMLAHNRKKPVIDPDVYVAPNATVCGDVRIGRGSIVMFGACELRKGNPDVVLPL